MTAADPDVRRVRWAEACRIVPTRYPTVFLYDRVADAADFDALYALEAMTNERLRDETGEVARVPRDQRVFGPGSGPIMAAFTHVNPLGSRFSDGAYGVFYA
ncbi:MAG: RES domain-containing protein, partial [Burkholderiales bacterium]|nr:RES domain-containing protein [Burkholderiales bacterium]